MNWSAELKVKKFSVIFHLLFITSICFPSHLHWSKFKTFYPTVKNDENCIYHCQTYLKKSIFVVSPQLFAFALSFSLNSCSTWFGVCLWFFLYLRCIIENILLELIIVRCNVLKPNKITNNTHCTLHTVVKNIFTDKHSSFLCVFPLNLIKPSTFHSVGFLSI